MASNPVPDEAPQVVVDVSPTVLPKRDGRPFFVILALAMLAIDQAFKYWVGSHMVQGQSIAWPWPGVLELKLTHNEGIAFGILRGKGGWFTPIALLITFGATWYSWKHPRDSRWLHAAMALLAAGAIGNLYDRLALGYVRDMFETRFMQFPVFNWADACITVATAILVLVWSKEAIDSKAKPHGVATPQD